MLTIRGRHQLDDAGLRVAREPRRFLECVPPAEIILDVFRKTHKERLNTDRFDQLNYVADTDILNHV
ncbi:hypothetical protein D9M72_633610 [compost metagenome]